MAVRQRNGPIERRFFAAERVAIQQRPQEREGSWIVNGDFEVELRKAPGVRTSGVEDSNGWSRDRDAPSQAVGDAVAHRITPRGRRIASPRRGEKNSNRRPIGLQKRVRCRSMLCSVLASPRP